MERGNINLRHKLTALPFRKIAPNMVTTLAICVGVTSMRYAITENWGKAVICIFIAAILDMLDGRVARMLKGSTKFGAELDSLSDFVSFGVAPAILMYKWTLYDFPRFGWFFCLLFPVCMAMRLARFNTMLENNPQPDYWRNFFVGVPAPAAAMLGILPIMLSFEFEAEFLRSNWFCCTVMFIVAMLMVSHIPTISVKYMKIPTYMMLPLLVVIVLFATMMLSQPWMVMNIMMMMYIASLPVGIIWFMRAKKAANRI